MATLLIPTDSDTPFYTQRTDLDGVEYLLTFTYNQRENCWYLSIADIDEFDLVNGIKIVPSINLLRQKPSRFLPPGTLLAISQTSDDSPPGFGELGIDRRFVLVYIEA